MLLLDDDFLWDIAVLHDFIYVMELHPYLDIVGGRAGLHFAGFLKVHNQTLFLVKVNHYHHSSLLTSNLPSLIKGRTWHFGGDRCDKWSTRKAM